MDSGEPLEQRHNITPRARNKSTASQGAIWTSLVRAILASESGEDGLALPSRAGPEVGTLYAFRPRSDRTLRLGRQILRIAAGNDCPRKRKRRNQRVVVGVQQDSSRERQATARFGPYKAGQQRKAGSATWTVMG